MNRYIWGKVEPFGIDGFDKLVLPFAFPVFKLLLAGDGLLDIREGLEIDQFVAVVFPGKNAALPFNVFHYSSGEVAGDACVEDFVVGAGYHVDVTDGFHSRVV